MEDGRRHRVRCRAPDGFERRLARAAPRRGALLRGRPALFLGRRSIRAGPRGHPPAARCCAARQRALHSRHALVRAARGARALRQARRRPVGAGADGLRRAALARPRDDRGDRDARRAGRRLLRRRDLPSQAAQERRLLRRGKRGRVPRQGTRRAAPAARGGTARPAALRILPAAQLRAVGRARPGDHGPARSRLALGPRGARAGVLRWLAGVAVPAGQPPTAARRDPGDPQDAALDRVAGLAAHRLGHVGIPAPAARARVRRTVRRDDRVAGAAAVHGKPARNGHARAARPARNPGRRRGGRLAPRRGQRARVVRGDDVRARGGLHVVHVARHADRDFPSRSPSTPHVSRRAS